MVVDISGDWREELIIGDSDGKGVTIYTPNGSPQKNFRSPLLDRQYRQHLARGSRLAGYYIRPTLSYRINEGTVSASALSQPLAHAAQPLGAVYNRSTNTLQIYGLQTESRARVALYTLRGERIFATTLSGQATSALSLPSTMAPGIYLFTLGTGGVNACQRVTIYR
jgi:hypothetical protein